jgi:cytochrome c oxidase subunit II
VRAPVRLAAFEAFALLSGGASNLSALEPAGPGAQDIAWLIRLFTAVLGAIWLAVMVALLLAARRGAPLDAPLDEDPSDRRRFIVVSAAVGATLLVIVALTLVSFATPSMPEKAGEPLAIKVTGHQWWWEVEYEDATPARVFRTANEIHIPVGELVELRLASADVIHSFWIPALTGKQDLIPAQTTMLRIKADRPGVYRGQCAEYCGLQHAHMGKFVIAQSRKDFDAWREGQIAAAAPEDASRRGREVFLSNACSLCHQIRGTTAGGAAGPDLTHLASRKTIAAGLLALNRANLTAWILDPRRLKPGANMPATPLAPRELGELVAFLETLK